MFNLDSDQDKQFKEWLKKHDETCIYSSGNCGGEVDVSDYHNW